MNDLESDNDMIKVEFEKNELNKNDWMEKGERHKNQLRGSCSSSNGRCLGKNQYGLVIN